MRRPWTIGLHCRPIAVFTHGHVVAINACAVTTPAPPRVHLPPDPGLSLALVAVHHPACPFAPGDTRVCIPLEGRT